MRFIKKIRSDSDVSLIFFSSVARWFSFFIQQEYGSVMVSKLCKMMRVKFRI